MMTVLLAVPLTIPYLGRERFGLWASATAFMALVGVADLGLGNGLITWVARARGRGDTAFARELVSSALALLAVVAAALGVVVLVLDRVLELGALIGARGGLGAEASTSLLVVSLCAVIGLPLGVPRRVQLALQVAVEANAWLLAGNVIGLVGVVVAALHHASVPWLVGAQMGGPLVATAVNAAVLFSRQHRELAPRIRYVARPAVRVLASTGGWLMVVQLATIIALYGDLLIVAHTSGEASAADYASSGRLMMIAPFAISLALMPLWAAYADAFARRDSAWVRTAFRRCSIGAVAIVGPACILLVVAGPAIISVWSNNHLDVSRQLVVGQALWTMVYTGWTVLSVLLNGMNVIKPQALLLLLTSAIAVPTMIIVGEHFGPAAVPLAAAATHLLLNVIPSALIARARLRDV